MDKLSKFRLSGRGHKTNFIPKNPSKYIGDYPIISLSSWELKMMNYFDTHPNVLFWASESLSVPFVNPVTKKIAKYFPDFLIITSDKNGKQHRQILEIKPLKETMMENAKTQKDKVAVIVNQAKWAAATKFAKDNGMIFRVLTEADIFGKK